MDANWRRRLSELGARFDEHNRVNDFGDNVAEREAARTQPALAPLPLGVISVTGAEAADFLHAQLTHDVLGLPPDAHRLAAWCDPKGRVQALFEVCPYEDGFLLVLPAALIEAVLPRLRMFVLRTQVTLADVSDHWNALGLCGAQAGEALAHSIDPPEPGRLAEADDTLALGLLGPQPRYLILAPSNAVERVWNRLATPAMPVGEPVWRLAAIEAGRPQVFPETAGEFVPQMLNLHWLDGIDFHKGCYPGQEVVARLQYRGTLKQRIYLGTLAADSPPAPGTEVAAEDDARVGTVIDAVTNADGAQRVLAVLKVAAADQALAIAGAKLCVDALPYRID